MILTSSILGSVIIGLINYVIPCNSMEPVCNALTCSFESSSEQPTCLWKSQWASAPNWIHAAESQSYDEKLQGEDRNHLAVIGDNRYVNTRIVLQSPEFVNTENALFSFKYFMGTRGMSLRLCVDEILCDCPSEQCLWNMRWDDSNPRFPITGPLNEWKPCKRQGRAFWDCDDGLKEVVDVPQGTHRFYFVAMGATRDSLLGVDSFDVVLENGLICTPDYDEKVDINGRSTRISDLTEIETVQPIELSTTTIPTTSTPTTTTTTTTTTTPKPTTTPTTTTTTTSTTTTTKPPTTTTPDWDEFFGLKYTTTRQPSRGRQLINLLARITPVTLAPRLELPTARPRSPYLRATRRPSAPKKNNFNFGLDLKKILGASSAAQPQKRNQIDYYPTIAPLKDRTINWLSAIGSSSANSNSNSIRETAATARPLNPDQLLAQTKRRRTIAPPITLPPVEQRTTKATTTTAATTTTSKQPLTTATITTTTSTTTAVPTTTAAPACFQGPVKVFFGKKILETLTEYQNWDGTLWECQTECLKRRDCASISYCVNTNPASCKLHGASCTELAGVCNPYAPQHQLGYYYEKRPYDFEACRLSEVDELFRRR